MSEKEEQKLNIGRVINYLIKKGFKPELRHDKIFTHYAITFSFYDSKGIEQFVIILTKPHQWSLLIDHHNNKPIVIDNWAELVKILDNIREQKYQKLEL